MIPADILLVFFAASVLLALAPGPDNIFVLTLSALHGPSAGWLVTLGLCTGLIVHTAAVAIGIAAVFQASELAFSALKVIGACYLLFLAWGAFRAPASRLEVDAETAPARGRLYRRGIVMNLTNPKVSIFFLAFLPQFADPARGPLSLQLALLGLVFIVAALLVFGAIAMVAGSLGGWLRRSPRAQLVMNRVAGVIFVVLALRLALMQR